MAAIETIRIKDIPTTATTAAADDYVLLDGATNGTRKGLASNLITSAAATAAAVAELALLPFAPTIPGLIAGWDHRATTVVGGKITEWADLSGNGHTLTSSVDAYRADYTGDAAILSSSADTGATRGYNITGNLTLDSRSSTIVFIRSNLAGAPAEMPRFDVLLYSGAFPLWVRDGHEWLHDMGQVLGAEMADGINGYALVRSATASYTQSNFAGRTSTGAYPQRTETFGNIFTTDTGTNPMATTGVKAVLCYNRALGASEVATIYRAYGISPQREKMLIIRGDSITQGQGATVNDARWGETVAKNCGLSLINGGARGAQASDVSQANNLPYCLSGGSSVVFIIGYGANDLRTATGRVSALQTNTQNIVGWCKAAYAGKTKCKVLVSTVLPGNAGFGVGQTAGGYETDRLAYRTWLLANYGSFCDGVIDIGDPATALGNSANIATYFSDGTHPNDAGYALYAAKAQAAIIALA